MSRLISSITNFIGKSNQNNELVANVAPNDKLYITEDVYIRKGELTGTDKYYVTLNNEHTVHRSRIAADIVADLKVGDYVVYKAEELDVCDNVLEIIDITDKDEVLKEEDWIAIPQVRSRFNMIGFNFFGPCSGFRSLK